MDRPRERSGLPAAYDARNTVCIQALDCHWLCWLCASCVHTRSGCERGHQRAAAQYIPQLERHNLNLNYFTWAHLSVHNLTRGEAR